MLEVWPQCPPHADIADTLFSGARVMLDVGVDVRADIQAIPPLRRARSEMPFARTPRRQRRADCSHPEAPAQSRPRPPQTRGSDRLSATAMLALPAAGVPANRRGERRCSRW